MEFGTEVKELSPGNECTYTNIRYHFSFNLIILHIPLSQLTISRMGTLRKSPVSNFLIAAFLLLIIFCFQYKSASAKETFWVGNIRSDLNYYLKAKLDLTDTTYSGTISLLKYDLTFPVNGKINDKKELSFTINFYQLDDINFNAVISDKEIKGDVSGKIAEGKFWLKQYDGTIDENSLTPLIGCYQMRSQRLLLTWGGDCSLSLMNLVNPKGFSLMPENDSTFFEWSSSSSFSFELLKRGDKLYYIGSNTVELKKINSEYKQERFTLLNDSIPMFGTLHYRERSKQKKHLLMILVPGAGGEHKDNFYYLQIADYFITKGYAVFLYDKRGTGESDGSWHNASYEVLADDVLKFAEILREDPVIDRSAITLFGSDQGGLVAPLAASKSFLITSVVSCMSNAAKAKDQEITNSINNSSIKLTPDEVTDLRKMYDKFFEYTQTGNGWDEYYQLASDAKNNRWFYSAGFLPLDKEDWRVKFWQANSKYDITELWQSVTAPSLIIYGMKDIKVPTSASIENMNRFINEGYKTNIEVDAYSELGHNIGKDQLDYIYTWLLLNQKK